MCDVWTFHNLALLMFAAAEHEQHHHLPIRHAAKGRSERCERGMCFEMCLQNCIFNSVETVIVCIYAHSR